MNKIYNPEKSTWHEILKRPTSTFADIELKVKDIFNEIQISGDEAVLKYTLLFDGISPENIEVSKKEIDEAISLVSNDLKNAIQLDRKSVV